MIEKFEPAYITIVEGPPPDFHDVSHEWAYGVLEGLENTDVAMCEMRTFDGPKLVKRCQEAWREGRPARLDFPTGEGARGASAARGRPARGRLRCAGLLGARNR